MLNTIRRHEVYDLGVTHHFKVAFAMSKLVADSVVANLGVSRAIPSHTLVRRISRLTECSREFRWDATKPVGQPLWNTQHKSGSTARSY